MGVMEILDGMMFESNRLCWTPVSYFVGFTVSPGRNEGECGGASEKVLCWF